MYAIDFKPNVQGNPLPYAAAAADLLNTLPGFNKVFPESAGKPGFDTYKSLESTKSAGKEIAFDATAAYLADKAHTTLVVPALTTLKRLADSEANLSAKVSAHTPQVVADVYNSISAPILSSIEYLWAKVVLTSALTYVQEQYKSLTTKTSLSTTSGK
jgi:hypothetical protein